MAGVTDSWEESPLKAWEYIKENFYQVFSDTAILQQHSNRLTELLASNFNPSDLTKIQVAFSANQEALARNQDLVAQLQPIKELIETGQQPNFGLTDVTIDPNTGIILSGGGLSGIGLAPFYWGIITAASIITLSVLLFNYGPIRDYAFKTFETIKSLAGEAVSFLGNSGTLILVGIGVYFYMTRRK